ncbi:Ingression protein [Lachnellula subtilissima]|uniref:Ingression protein n=1 Tax=Lachnellula subtilissima TaxID=602034 RepID=A0A8H8RFA9_9HELO|nr:Ingression protein [Lachnellula subtilissima]
MATKSRANGLNTMHTAGIFSDMTVDGPEIGTLVIIVDRAKNLPNRKTIGKQDPYCAARLGKEAKKTETDRRGGQTPRWDQELRFTVHDSADYYQLKVSVFNDDKKTDLIGESWINLQDVVVPGGGQNDLWHNLNCRGKYAGEIRIEITYYDTRPKQDKPEKTKQAATNGVEEGARDSLKGPRQPKSTPVKRRPLPSDPVTGAPAPAPIPDHVQTPPRGYQPQAGTPDYVQRGHQSAGTPEYAPTTPRGQPPSAIPDHVQTPPRGHQSPGYIPNQSPLQNVEYGTPPSHFPSYNNSPSMNGYVAAPIPIAQPVAHERYEIYDPAAATNNHIANGNGRGHHEADEEVDPRDAYNSQHSPYELPQPEDFGPPPSPGGPPPPPPAHRSRHGSNQVSPAPAMISQGSYGYPSDQRPSNPYDMPPDDFHGHSMPTYSQGNSYQQYGSPGHDDQFRKSDNSSFQQPTPQHDSYDSRFNDYGSMQPTVEDAPPSPSPYSRHQGSTSHSSQYEERKYDQVPSPAPLNLNGRGSDISSRSAANSAPSHQYSNSSGYPASNSDLSYREPSYTASSVSPRPAYSQMPQQSQQPRKQSYDPPVGPAEDYGIPVPATLVPGMDPMIAQEISERIYDEKRASYNQQGGNSRGRLDSVPYQQSRPHPLSYQEAPPPFVPAAASYDDRQSQFSNTTVALVKPRAISPDPRVPARKSVSPYAAAADDGRRLSGVPFGPDSYNALNPKISGSISTLSLSSKYDTKEPDVDAKIITHDGREIDPSDHIPESNYAPLLESKGPKYASQLPDRNYRPAPNGPQPLSASGRRPLKVAPRPHSMSTPPAPTYTSGPSDPMTPTGRNRLQKKSNRMSAQPAPHSSPLAPITPYQNNSYTPRSQARPNTGDYNANENYSPHGNSGYRGSVGAPPIPAKVPMGMGSAPPPQSGGGDAWALLEEMKNIDLGGGRSRRRGY